jgi:hypothetical protein
MFLKIEIIFKMILNDAGGAPAQSCEGRTGPSLHPPHPWPTPSTYKTVYTLHKMKFQID